MAEANDTSELSGDKRQGTFKKHVPLTVGGGGASIMCDTRS